jgi:hypothetical protein
VTIRLIYYDKSIKRRFVAQHQGLIRAGFASLGIAAPQFASIERKTALARIVDFESRPARAPAVAQLRE